ncbi:MAG: hypothetical protein OXB84_02810 [Halobacteriovoraceae bacterium]|nr:hypothetical protein [Halobacteriovoraceae bacterium]
MIFNYVYNGEFNLINIPNIISSYSFAKNLGERLLLFACVILILSLLFKKIKKIPTRYTSFFYTILILILYTSAYLGTVIPMDEIMINLEHPYNFFHHGKFSFSPEQMIGGTVELVYYLLLTPFSKNQSSLIFFNHLLGYILGGISMLLLYNFFKDRTHAKTAYLLTALASIYLPLIRIFSNGFGNCLVGLLFLISLIDYEKRNYTRFTYISGILPIIRPDAFIVSCGLFIFDFFKTRKINKKGILITCISLALFFITYKILYNVWIPIPIKFKSVNLSMIALLGKSDIIKSLIAYLKYAHCFSFLIFIYLYKRINNKNFIPHYILFILLSLFFFTQQTFHFNPIQDNRYHVALEFLFVFIPLLMIASNVKNINKDSVRIFYSILFLYILASYGRMKIKNEKLALSTYTIESYASGAIILDRLLPNEWQIAAAELNTFGFYLKNRSIYDLWGYVNPEIASSKFCSEQKIKTAHPDKTKIDVIWYMSSKETDTNSLSKSTLFLKIYDLPFLSNLSYIKNMKLKKTLKNFPPLPSLGSEEIGLVEYNSHFGLKKNQLGNMIEIYNKYDIWTIKYRSYKMLLLVRKEYRERFSLILKNNNYKRLNERKIKIDEVKKTYDHSKLKLYKCG